MVGQTMRVPVYHIHEAENGQESIVLGQKHGEEVHLLYTAIVMPEGMTGLKIRACLDRES
jgi:hypothetical protein